MKDARGLIRDFRYDSNDREQILDLLQPLYSSTIEALTQGRQATEIALEKIEQTARKALRDYIDSVSPRHRRRHYQKVSKAASTLLQILNSGDLGGGSAGYYISGYGRTDTSPDDYAFLPIFKGALAELAATTATLGRSKNPPYPGYEDPYSGAHDPEKIEFAQGVLFTFVIEANKKPGRSTTGPAARLLIAAIDPVMRYARSMGIERANQIREGHNAKTLIDTVLSRTPLGDNLPEL